MRSPSLSLSLSPSLPLLLTLSLCVALCCATPTVDGNVTACPTSTTGENCTLPLDGSSPVTDCGPHGICGPCGECFCSIDYWHRPGQEGCVAKPSKLSMVSSFCGLCLFLLVGKLLRVYVKPLSMLYLPSSVLGGLFGLLFVQLSQRIPAPNNWWYVYLDREWIGSWDSLPGFLINIVFATLFIGNPLPSVRQVMVKSGTNYFYGMFVAWTQWGIAAVVTTALLVPFFPDVNQYFYLIIPVGFAGGHGTAAGLRGAFENIGFDNGADVSLAVATIGLLASVILGMVLVNVAARYGWVKHSKVTMATSSWAMKGISELEGRRSAGSVTVTPDSIDVMALHLFLTGIAVAIGYGVRAGLVAIENTSATLTEYQVFSGLPLFPLAMMGGIVIQLIMGRFNHSKLIDSDIIDRISGTSLDFLVVAAMAKVDVSAIGGNLVPFVIIVGVALVWQFVCIFAISRFFHRGHFFEHGIAVYGQSVGVIATGLILLRMVDPDGKTPVPAAFAFKQLLHAPIMGGGLWTAIAFPVSRIVGPYGMIGICAGVSLLWLAIARIYLKCSKPSTLESSNEFLANSDGDDWGPPPGAEEYLGTDVDNSEFHGLLDASEYASVELEAGADDGEFTW